MLCETHWSSLVDLSRWKKNGREKNLYLFLSLSRSLWSSSSLILFVHTDIYKIGKFFGSARVESRRYSQPGFEVFRED